ncbi:MAG: methyltransferase [Candidatus Electrothrix sp. AR4]|nr:methyltransferase [Candidatus Electrothrix sp. AR4]
MSSLFHSSTPSNAIGRSLDCRHSFTSVPKNERLHLNNYLDSSNYYVSFPKKNRKDASQDQEYFLFQDEKKTFQEKIRLHDYGRIFEIKGLYEKIYTELLECNSPKTVCSMLIDSVNEYSDVEKGSLRIIDLGAGNGMAGEELIRHNVNKIIGIDIDQYAKKATERDRPGIYDKYFVTDLSAPDTSVSSELDEMKCNCMTSISNLGFHDIPTQAFVTGFNFIEFSGYIAFNIKETFFEDTDNEFCRLISYLQKNGALEILQQKKYIHRKSTDGMPLYYLAIVARKKYNIPANWATCLTQ